MNIRERPPLRHTIEARAPSGKRYRWAGDEPNPANVFSGLRYSSTVPGGYESMDCVLPRKPRVDYSDLERLTTLHVLCAGERVGEYRLERAPRISGSEMAVSPSAVGWQAHLEDDKSAVEVYIDQNLGSWGELTVENRLRILQANLVLDKDYTATVDRGLMFSGVSGQAISAFSETWLMYVAPAGVKLAKMMYVGAQRNTANMAGGELFSDDNPALSSAATVALTLDGTLRTAILAAAERYLGLAAYCTATHTPAAASPFSREYTKVGVYGNHGLTTRANGSDPDGLFASDVIPHALSRWAPLLRYTTGPDGTIQATSFVIPQLVFLERTTAAEIVRQANRFHLYDWAVWDDKTFHYHRRGDRGRKWQARVGPAKLEETGPQIDRLWESVIVQYQDVNGQTLTVGPPGSGADTESSLLKDSDPENPANKLGIVRRDLLAMGVGTAASAAEVGARFLAEQKLLDTSGRATLIGYVEDDRGVIHPTAHVKAGDAIAFVDAADTGHRRIIKADHSYDQRSCSIDLDSPPEGLAALLERLGVVLVPLGVG